MNLAKKPVGIRDVARRAGVSVSAVSFALNGTGTLGDETRERIRRIADSMNYRANALARGMRKSRIGAIGFVTRPLDTIGAYRPDGVDVFGRSTGAAAAAAMDLGLGLVLLPDLTSGPLPPLALALDGYVVLHPVEDDDVISLLIEHDIPYVTIGADPSHPEHAHRVARDERLAARQALDDMWGQGSRSIAYVGGTALDSFNLESELAYLEWVAERGGVPTIEHAPEGDGVAGGRAACSRLLDAADPDGIYCLTGRHAAGALEELQDRGIAVPGDVRVASGSDAEQTRSARPAISSVEMPAEELGAAAVRLLGTILQGDSDEAVAHALRPRYRRRASTA